MDPVSVATASPTTAPKPCACSSRTLLSREAAGREGAPRSSPSACSASKTATESHGRIARCASSRPSLASATPRPARSYNASSQSVFRVRRSSKPAKISSREGSHTTAVRLVVPRRGRVSETAASDDGGWPTTSRADDARPMRGLHRACRPPLRFSSRARFDQPRKFRRTAFVEHRRPPWTLP